MAIAVRKPSRLVIVDVDGLRRDVFRDGLAACHVDAFSTAPSATFAAQASMFSGQYPGAHAIAGNESFDRLGRISGGRPRYFGFDVGYTLAVDDAVRVFSAGLASQLLDDETAAAHGLNSAVIYNMYARGADRWLRDVIDPQIGLLLAVLERYEILPGTVVGPTLRAMRRTFYRWPRHSARRARPANTRTTCGAVWN